MTVTTPVLRAAERIAQALGVRTVPARKRPEPRYGGRPFAAQTKMLHAYLKRLEATGLKRKQIARMAGVSIVTVRNHLGRRGAKK